MNPELARILVRLQPFVVRFFPGTQPRTVVDEMVRIVDDVLLRNGRAYDEAYKTELFCTYVEKQSDKLVKSLRKSLPPLPSPALCNELVFLYPVDNAAWTLKTVSGIEGSCRVDAVCAAVRMPSGMPLRIYIGPPAELEGYTGYGLECPLTLAQLASVGKPLYAAWPTSMRLVVNDRWEASGQAAALLTHSTKESVGHSLVNYCLQQGLNPETATLREKHSRTLYDFRSQTPVQHLAQPLRLESTRTWEREAADTLLKKPVGRPTQNSGTWREIERQTQAIVRPAF
jgi:hypothetical protein